MAAALVLAAAASAAHGENEPPGGIVWRIGLYQGFKQACREKKPLVVFIYQEKCPSCDKMMATLTDQHLGVVADRATFIWQDADREDTKGNVGTLIKDLRIDRVPVVVVLDVTEQKVEEVGRVLGYYPPEETLRRLQPLLDKLPNVSGSTPPPAAQRNEAPRAAQAGSVPPPAQSEDAGDRKALSVN
jgi:hypothetical protein